ncbi:MAG: hypothetical protein AB8B64_25090 [Granulosicoccus sp.]
MMASNNEVETSLVTGRMRLLEIITCKATPKLGNCTDLADSDVGTSAGYVGSPSLRFLI